MRCKIKVRFGSRKYPYEWFPLQFLLVYRGGELCQAFPCMLEGGYVQPEDFLERLLAGEAWTVGARRKSRGRDYDRIVEYLMANSDVLEPGLTLLGAEHLVSDASGETGFLDLLFRDRESRHLIVASASLPAYPRPPTSKSTGDPTARPTSPPPASITGAPNSASPP